MFFYLCPTMMPNSLVTYLCSLPACEKKIADTADSAPSSDHVTVSILMPADEDEARRFVLPRLVATTCTATFPCDTSAGTVVSIATSVMQPLTSSFDAPRSLVNVATTQSDPSVPGVAARTPVCVFGVAYRSSPSSVTSQLKPVCIYSVHGTPTNQKA